MNPLDKGPLINRSGITIRELKELVRDLPETDEFGEDFEVWIDGTGCAPGSSNVAKEIWKLNRGDILIEI